YTNIIHDQIQQRHIFDTLCSISIISRFRDGDAANSCNLIFDFFMSFNDLPNLWVPLALLGLIIAAAVFFSRSS
ncbi:hypothetical protein CEN41_15930, partial [Fischerella thermalis CCMEE 5330]